MTGDPRAKPNGQRQPSAENRGATTERDEQARAIDLIASSNALPHSRTPAHLRISLDDSARRCRGAAEV